MSNFFNKIILFVFLSIIFSSSFSSATEISDDQVESLKKRVQDLKRDKEVLTLKKEIAELKLESNKSAGARKSRGFIQLKYGSTHINGFSSEGETPALALGYVGAKGVGFEVEGGKANGDYWDYEYGGIYATYRSNGDLYFKSKIGALDTDSVVSIGFGVGRQFAKTFAVELEVSFLDEEAKYGSLGLMFMF